MKRIVHTNINEIQSQDGVCHEGFEFVRNTLVSCKDTDNCLLAVYEIAPLKSAFPYHYHLKNEEVYYILSGEGLLKTPDGEKRVEAGDVLYFPANENGAHRLTNTSKTEPLKYLDFDVTHDIEATVYPDSDKIAIWGKNTNRIFKIKNNVDYYEGE